MKLLKGWGWLLTAWICIAVSRIPGLSLEVVGVLSLIGIICAVVALARAGIDYRRRSRQLEG